MMALFSLGLRWVVPVLALSSRIHTPVSALSPEHAVITRGRLSQAFSSPSGKLTYSPEIVIPEPKDSTAILLLSNAVQNLSGRIRGCKANAAFVKGSMTALRTFTNEQETARGNFPGPVPVVFCGAVSIDNVRDIAEAGADGVLVRICDGKNIVSADDVNGDATWREICQLALQNGLQPIPELTIDQERAVGWSEDEFKTIVEQVSSHVGTDLVAVLVTVNALESDDKDVPVALPTVSKSLGKTTPILGSVRASAGENRINTECQRFKDSGFTGTLLRSDCVPGFRLNLDLEIVGRFWQACINDLKSTRSKSFAFRSKNNMEKSLATQWGNYQKSVIESGALGDPGESVSLNEAGGDYQGFA